MSGFINMGGSSNGAVSPRSDGEINALIAAAMAASPHTLDTTRSDAEINALITAQIQALPSDQVRTDAEINTLIATAMAAVHNAENDQTDAEITAQITSAITQSLLDNPRRTDAEIISVANDTLINGIRTIRNVPSAVKSFSGSAIGPYIVIGLPVGFMGSMVNMVINMYSYYEAVPIRLVMDFYLYAGWGNFYVPRAYPLTDPRRLPGTIEVKFGVNSSNGMPVIVINPGTSKNAYGSFTLPELNIKYYAQDLAEWATGWNIYRATDTSVLDTSTTITTRTITKNLSTG